MTECKDTLRKHISLDRIVSDTIDLVRIPSYPGILQQETAVAECLKKKFLEAGIEAFTEETEDGRRNIYARLPGTGGGRVCHSEYEYVPLGDYEDVCLEYALTALNYCN